MQNSPVQKIDSFDRKIIQATQSGLPIVSRPYDAIATEVGLNPDEVKTRFTKMLETGVIRRIGVIPNHYVIGYSSNGMSVWDIKDELIDEIGEQVGALDYVTHCYQRPRHLPDWPYNFFAMVHGKSRDEVETKVREIAAIIDNAANSHDILYSTKILKKTGLRLGNIEGKKCSD